MRKVLIIEDDREISAMLAEYLTKQGLQTSVSYTGTDGMKLAKSGDYQMILLDLMLPYLSGDALLEELRKISNVPVIVLSAKETTRNKIDLLRLGADDYITKPFDLEEVFVRMEAVFRRNSENGLSNRYEHHMILLNTDEKSVTVLGHAVELSAKEYLLLELFMRNPSKVFSKNNLYESVWGEEYMGDDNTLMVHISNLRSKLKKAGADSDIIETVWGLGYRLGKETN